MKNLSRLTVFLALIGLAAFSPAAFAVGTAAGTTISNQAHADYKDANGNNLPTVYSNTVTTIVSQVAGVDVSPETSTATGAQGTIVSFSSLITNTGNGPDTMTLAAVNANAWATRIYLDTNGNGIRDAGEDTIVASTTLLPADASFRVILEVDVPALTPIHTSSATTLTATLAQERAAQTTLRTQTNALRTQLAARQRAIEELTRENQELRDWARQHLPAAARRLRERPALTGADAYRDWLSRRDAVRAAGDGTGQ